MPMMVTEADVARVLDMPAAIAALETAFLAQARGDIVNMPRQRANFAGSRLNVMAAGSKTGSRYAMKAYGSAGHHVLLYEAGKGLLAVIEAAALGQIRTGAATAVATRRLASPSANRLGLIGAGRQARTQALAVASVLKLERIDAFARDRAKLASFCDSLERACGIAVEPATTAETAVAGAVVVVTATTSKTPVVESAWLAAGTHVNAVGANAAERRELGPGILERASLIVVDDPEQARVEAGELIDVANEGRLEWSALTPLARLVATPDLPRGPGDLTVFKSLGTALEDLASASLVYDRMIAATN